MSLNDKINAIVSLKGWMIQNTQYETFIQLRDIEKSLLEVSNDYVKVIKDIQYLSNEQKIFLLSIVNWNSLLNKQLRRELKILLIEDL
jgi:predicted RNA-binding protein with RPS1 domain